MVTKWWSVVNEYAKSGVDLDKLREYHSLISSRLSSQAYPSVSGIMQVP